MIKQLTDEQKKEMLKYVNHVATAQRDHYSLQRVYNRWSRLKLYPLNFEKILIQNNILCEYLKGNVSLRAIRAVYGHCEDVGTATKQDVIKIKSMQTNRCKWGEYATTRKATNT